MLCIDHRCVVRAAVFQLQRAAIPLLAWSTLTSSWPRLRSRSGPSVHIAVIRRALTALRKYVRYATHASSFLVSPTLLTRVELSSRLARVVGSSCLQSGVS